MDNKVVKNIGDYAKKFSEKKFIESGYIAVRESDGIAITVQKADFNNIGENDVVFVNDKNIESFEGNFRAAAVILFCAIRQDKTAEAAAIVDSDCILNFSSKRKPLQPVMDNVAKLLGVTVKCASKNVAAEIVTALSGYRNACFMPDAGAVLKARSLKELLEATDVLDKACNAEILAEDKGGTQHLNPVNAFIEQMIYKFKTRSESDAKSDNADNLTTTEIAVQNDGAAEDNGSQEENSSSTENNSQGDSNNNQIENVENNQDAQNVQNAGQTDVGSNNKSHEVCKPVWGVAKGGKFVAMASPKYVTAVCAIGKPMAVTDEYKDKLGEEISCIPSKMIMSNKAFEKMLEQTGDTKICFMAQHGVIIKTDSEQEFSSVLELVENACKSYF